MTETDRNFDSDRALGHWAVWSRPVIVLSAGAAFTAFALANVLAAEPGALLQIAPFILLGHAVLFGLAAAFLSSGWLAFIATAGLLLAGLWTLGVLAVMGVPFLAPVLYALLSVEAIAAALSVQEISQAVLEVCRGAPPASAGLMVARRTVLPGGAVLLAPMAAILAIALEGRFSLYEAWGVIAASGCAFTALLFWLLPAQVSQFPFEESFIGAINATREWRERALAPAAIVTQSRWAFSLTGMCAILIAIAYFQDAKMPVLPALWRAGGAGFAFAFLAAGFLGVLVTRDWRNALAVPLPPFVAAATGCEIAGHLDLATMSDLAMIGIAAASGGGALAILLAAALASFRRFGDSVHLAATRVIQDAWLIALLSGGMVIAAALFFALVSENALALAIVLMPVLVAVLVFVPVLTSVFDALFPRKRSLEELYGTR